MTSEAVPTQPLMQAWNTISCLALAYAGERQIPESEVQHMLSGIAKHTSAYVFLQGEIMNLAGRAAHTSRCWTRFDSKKSRDRTFMMQ